MLIYVFYKLYIVFYCNSAFWLSFCKINKFNSIILYYSPKINNFAAVLIIIQDMLLL